MVTSAFDKISCSCCRCLVDVVKVVPFPQEVPKFWQLLIINYRITARVIIAAVIVSVVASVEPHLDATRLVYYWVLTTGLRVQVLIYCLGPVLCSASIHVLEYR